MHSLFNEIVVFLYSPIVKLDFNNYGGVVSLPRPLPKIG